MSSVQGREFSAFAKEDDLSEMMKTPTNIFYSLYRNIKRSLGNEFLELIDQTLTSERSVSYSACDIKIVRNTRYFVLNFVLMIALFTVVSFVVFCVSIEEVHDRWYVSIRGNAHAHVHVQAYSSYSLLKLQRQTDVSATSFG